MEKPHWLFVKGTQGDANFQDGLQKYIIPAPLCSFCSLNLFFLTDSMLGRMGKNENQGISLRNMYMYQSYLSLSTLRQEVDIHVFPPAMLTKITITYFYYLCQMSTHTRMHKCCAHTHDYCHHHVCLNDYQLLTLSHIVKILMSTRQRESL